MQNKSITYRPGMSRQETYGMIKAVGVPLIVFALCLYTISNFGSYGSKVICPMSGAVWLGGFLTALYLPVERRQTISQTMGICTIYCCTLLGLKIALGIVSGASAEMIAASYDQPIPLATGNALPGVLSNIMMIGSAFIPGSYLAMLLKKVVQYRKTKNMQETYEQVRGINNSGHQHTRRY